MARMRATKKSTAWYGIRGQATTYQEGLGYKLKCIRVSSAWPKLQAPSVKPQA